MNIKPRKWQEKALKKWESKKRGIVRVVTGGGKTFFAFLCIRLLLKKKKDIQIVIFVPSLMLLDQWLVELEAFFNDTLKVTLCGGGFKPEKNSNIILSTLDSGDKALKLIEEPSKTFCIVDECHRAGSHKRSEMVKKSWGYSLGLSATPERDYDQALEEVLIPYLGEIIYSYNYSEALKDGVISNFELVNVKIPLLSDEQEDYEKLTSKIGKRIGVLGKDDLNDNVLKMLKIQRKKILNQAFLKAPTARRLINLNEASKWLIFCEQIDQAETINNLIDKKGLRSATYHTKLPMVIRKDNLSMFREGLIDVLISCKSLDEGFDLPSAEGAIIVSASATARQRIQRMGRVLRKTSKKDIAKVYTFYCTEQEKEKLEIEEIDFVGQVKTTWLTAERNE